MARSNGKTETEARDLDLEHELPPAEEASEEQAQAAAAGEDVSVLRGELEKAQAERNLLLDRMARLQAEFDNARKRAAREQQEYKDFALTDALKNLLPILDSFDRALQIKVQKHEDFRAGVELIRKQLQDALEKLGLRPIPAKGEPFDPRLHEAIEMVDSDTVPDHHVLDEMQRGYKLKDRLLRPSMVRVARNSKK
ncbi:MAG TPA: nucleotide exchange factor GrpE [Terriglobales bacterium]|nr:nucleotide exchange factor GrpE [Terriglobales bacterium]